jgi:hypothetical protein
MLHLRNSSAEPEGAGPGSAAGLLSGLVVLESQEALDAATVIRSAAKGQRLCFFGGMRALADLRGTWLPNFGLQCTRRRLIPTVRRSRPPSRLPQPQGAVAFPEGRMTGDRRRVDGGAHSRASKRSSSEAGSASRLTTRPSRIRLEPASRLVMPVLSNLTSYSFRASSPRGRRR